MNNKFSSFTLAALKVIGKTGALAIMLTNPYMAEIIGSYDVGISRRRFYPSQANIVVRRLRQNGCIEIVERNGIPCYALTEKGKHVLVKYELKNTTINEPRRWDKKWRVVIFDVKEKRRSCRDAIRKSLKQLNFQHLQDSVWIHPYPCESVIELARTAYGVRHDAKYLVCDRFYGDSKFLSAFDLSDDS